MRAWTPSRCVRACLPVCSTVVVPSGSSRSHLCLTSACLLASADRLARTGSLLQAGATGVWYKMLRWQLTVGAGRRSCGAATTLMRGGSDYPALGSVRVGGGGGEGLVSKHLLVVDSVLLHTIEEARAPMVRGICSCKSASIAVIAMGKQHPLLLAEGQTTPHSCSASIIAMDQYCSPANSISTIPTGSIPMVAVSA